MPDFNGKVVVVTGGFGILGQAVAKAAIDAGAKVALVDRAPSARPDGVEAALSLGGVDLADPAEAGKAMDAVAARLGAIDALANVAGGFRWITLEDGGAEVWGELYRMNALTAASACKAALPHLKSGSGGAVVTVAAAAGAKAAEGMGAYAASKAAVLRLTESLAEEMKDHGVRVNAVSPTIIDTPTNRADMPKADVSRWVTPADLAAVILFLASDDSRAVTGANVLVAGRV